MRWDSYFEIVPRNFAWYIYLALICTTVEGGDTLQVPKVIFLQTRPNQRGEKTNLCRNLHREHGGVFLKLI